MTANSQEFKNTETKGRFATPIFKMLSSKEPYPSENFYVA